MYAISVGFLDTGEYASIEIRLSYRDQLDWLKTLVEFGFGIIWAALRLDGIRRRHPVRRVTERAATAVDLPFVFAAAIQFRLA